MNRYVALLRAINVGGHNVKMDRLRALFQELGFGKVETLIASGNVIFEAPPAEAAALEARIERHLRDALGYDVATFVRTSAEIATLAGIEAFPAPEAGGEPSLMIAFLKAPPDAEAVQRLMAHRTPTDDFRVHGREFYWLRRTRVSDSAFSGAALEKAVRAPATMRSATTVRKLAAKVGGQGRLATE